MTKQRGQEVMMRYKLGLKRTGQIHLSEHRDKLAELAEFEDVEINNLVALATSSRGTSSTSRYPGRAYICYTTVLRMRSHQISSSWLVGGTRA